MILLDEIEKAHPDVFNILLQVLDDGRLTDSHGRTVNFKNTIIIMTSNLGSQFLLEGIGESGEITDDVQNAVTDLLKRTFRPEFLNRLDETVIFKPLSKKEITSIVRLMLEDLEGRVAQRGLRLDVSDKAADLLIERGYDPVYGARPLKRRIQSDIETPIARTIVGGDFASDSTIYVDAEEANFTFRVA